MATDLGKNVVVADQLEALAIAAKNYTLAETAYNQSKIMTTLNTIEGKIDSLGGGSSTTALTTPTLSLGSWSKADTLYTASLSYSGDGTLSTNIGSISGTTLSVTDEDGSFNGVFTATAGTSFAATTLNFSYDTTGSDSSVKQDSFICVLYDGDYIKPYPYTEETYVPYPYKDYQEEQLLKKGMLRAPAILPYDLVASAPLQVLIVDISEYHYEYFYKYITVEYNGDGQLLALSSIPNLMVNVIPMPDDPDVKALYGALVTNWDGISTSPTSDFTVTVYAIETDNYKATSMTFLVSLSSE